MGVLKELKIKDLVTLFGTSCGIFSLVLSIDGRYLYIAGSFIYFAMIFDLLDGLVAKKMNQTNELGKQLDSLSDVICFGAAPALLAYQAYTGSGAFPPFVLAIFCTLYVTGAILRLAWFNINTEKGYEGVTTPVTASILLSLFFIDTFYVYFSDAGPLLGRIMKYIIPICMIILPYLNVTHFISYGESIRTRKNKQLVVFLILIMGFGLVASILVFFNHTIVGPYIYGLSVAILVMLVFYIGIGVYNFLKKKRIKK